VLDPGRGRTKTGRLWGYAVDDRPWDGETPPAAVYLYAEDRKGEHPATHLAGFQGVLQVDGYSGFKSLLTGRPPDRTKLAFCWAHCRRRFYELHQSTGSPLAEEGAAPDRGALQGGGGDSWPFRRGATHSPAGAQQAARGRSARLADGPAERVSGRSTLAEAIRYGLRHWTGLVLFLDDGRLELDTNTVERAIRPIALGRKNSLFAESDGGARHWAIVASLVATAKLNGGRALTNLPLLYPTGYPSCRVSGISVGD
jgi:hypothetical protein